MRCEQTSCKVFISVKNIQYVSMWKACGEMWRIQGAQGRPTPPPKIIIDPEIAIDEHNYIIK